MWFGSQVGGYANTRLNIESPSLVRMGDSLFQLKPWTFEYCSRKIEFNSSFPNPRCPACCLPPCSRVVIPVKQPSRVSSEISSFVCPVNCQIKRLRLYVLKMRFVPAWIFDSEQKVHQSLSHHPDFPEAGKRKKREPMRLRKRHKIDSITPQQSPSGDGLSTW